MTYLLIVILFSYPSSMVVRVAEYNTEVSCIAAAKVAGYGAKCIPVSNSGRIRGL